MTMEITFWGVRGSLPVSGDQYQETGGHTSCVSVELNQKHIVIFDAGSGLYDCGQWLMTTPYRSVDLFITHLHIDHILGLPFFILVWNPECTINLYSERPDFMQFLEQTLFHHPLFPVNLKDVQGRLNFHQVTVGEPISLHDHTTINSHPLNHPGGAVGYRLTTHDKSMCYITDTEHDPNELNQELVKFIKKTNLLVYDSAYTEEEYLRKRGWGHSTHIRAAELAQAAMVEKLALFHHDISHDDTIVLKAESEAQKIFPATFAARQGMKIII